MAASGEADDGLIERLKYQLETTFGCAGQGSVNIHELHKLLHNLIDLHARCVDARKKNRTACEGLHSSKEGSKGSNQTITRSSETETSREIVGGTGPPDYLDPDWNAGQERRTSISCDGTIEEELSANKASTAPQHGTEENTIDQQTHDGSTTKKTEDQASSSFRSFDNLSNHAKERQVVNIARSSVASLQRSSDFNVKSTTSAAEESSSMQLNDDKSSYISKVDKHSNLRELQRLPGTVCEEFAASTSQDKGSSGKSTSSTRVGTPIATSYGSLQPQHDITAVLAGCRNHLEIVKEEMLALKTRGRSQHADILKLDGTLDCLVERFDGQKLTVAKLEKDLHCLGMLLSDYEHKFAQIEKQLERQDVRFRDFERTLQRMNKEHDTIRVELRTVSEQANYLSNAKADRMDVQTELNRRALSTDMQLRVPYDVFKDSMRDHSRSVTQLREGLHELDENLKTVQYELVKGLDTKASAQDLSQIRKQLVGLLDRWRKANKSQKLSGTSTQLVLGEFRSAAVTTADPVALNPALSKCLSCGTKTILEGSKCAVPLPAKFVPSIKVRSHARNAGGFHTKCAHPEKIFRTGSLAVVKEFFTEYKGVQKF